MARDGYETVHFDSRDGLRMTADHYRAVEATDLVVLCHRSHSSRWEYQEAAPKLQAMGYSCLAIDQRSGMNARGMRNETSSLAKEQGLATGYLDTRPDIEAAVDYAYGLNGDNPVFLLGSSYSASLALLIARDRPQVKAVVAFSPGEFLKRVDLAEAIRDLDKPVWAAGAKKEIDDVAGVFRNVGPSVVELYRPEAEGFHGSKMLRESVAGYESVWESLEAFLDEQRTPLAE